MKTDLLGISNWYVQGKGPRYLQLSRYLSELIASGELSVHSQLPPERELANLASVSRVTIRQAITELASQGLVEQRRGAGSFVIERSAKLEQSLSSLVSFTETMAARGKTSDSKILSHGLHSPSTEEVVALGLGFSARVARIERLRLADDAPMAIEVSSLPESVLNRPEKVTTSLYKVLREIRRPVVRAIQRVTAINLPPYHAKMLHMAEGDAALKIVRTGYLDSGRPVEWTQGIYRSDMYDFVSELRLDQVVSE